VDEGKFCNSLNLRIKITWRASLKEKLGFLGYEILLKDEISWNLEGIWRKQWSVLTKL